MRNTRSLIALVAVAVAAFALGRMGMPDSAPALAQPPKEGNKPAAQPPGDMPEMPPQMMEFMAKQQPGAAHEALNPLVGEWEGTVRFWSAPGAAPMETTGTIKREWDFDGRFVIEHVHANWMGQPFHGMGIVGYNTVDNKYESVWIENMSTYISTAAGSYDAAKKTLTFTGDMYDPMTSKKVKSRSVVNLSDPNREMMEGFCPGPDGKEFKNFEGDFKRTK